MFVVIVTLLQFFKYFSYWRTAQDEQKYDLFAHSERKGLEFNLNRYFMLYNGT